MSIPPKLTDADPPKPGLPLLIGATLLVLLDMWLGFAREMRSSGGNIPAGLGAAVAELVIPVMVALLFSISQRFRNARSRTKVVLWTSILVLIAGFGAQKNNPEAQLAAAVKELNAAPRMVDAVTRLDRATQGPGMHLTIDETIVTTNAADISKEVWQRAVPKLRQQMRTGAAGKILAAGVSVTYRYYGKDGVLIGEVSSN
jgi:hypothetical protein